VLRSAAIPIPEAGYNIITYIVNNKSTPVLSGKIFHVTVARDFSKSARPKALMSDIFVYPQTYH
jgi:ABC-type phosphate transport system auxiliary subunit